MAPGSEPCQTDPVSGPSIMEGWCSSFRLNLVAETLSSGVRTAKTGEERHTSDPGSVRNCRREGGSVSAGESKEIRPPTASIQAGESSRRRDGWRLGDLGTGCPVVPSGEPFLTQNRSQESRARGDAREERRALQNRRRRAERRLRREQDRPMTRAAGEKRKKTTSRVGNG